MPYYKNIDNPIYWDITENTILKYTVDEHEKIAVKRYTYGHGFAATVRSWSKKISLSEFMKFVEKNSKQHNN